MSGSMGDMGSLLKQAQAMQREMDRVTEELKNARVEGSAGGGMVRIELTGDAQVERVELSDEVLATEDKAAIEDLILAAMRDALGRVQTLREESMGRVTGGINLPGMG